MCPRRWVLGSAHLPASLFTEIRFLLPNQMDAVHQSLSSIPPATPASKLRQNPSEHWALIMTCRSPTTSCNLENVLSPKAGARFHIISLSLSFKSLFVALITRTMCLVDWKLYYSVSCLQKNKYKHLEANHEVISFWFFANWVVCMHPHWADTAAISVANTK